MAFFNWNYGGFQQQYNNPYNGGFSNLNVVKLNNGPAYFVALAPFFSLFLEGITGDRIAAIVLWIFTYVLCVLVCKYDKDKILSRCYDVKVLDKLIFIPVVYLAVRGTKVTRQGSGCLALCIAALFIAILRNGFVSYYMTGDDSYIITVEEYSYSEFINTEEIDNYLNPSVKDVVYGCLDTPRWLCETKDYETTVSVTGYLNSETVTINFEMWYDGFKFEGIDISGVKIDGEFISQDEIEDFLCEMYFIYYDSMTVDKNYVEA